MQLFVGSEALAAGVLTRGTLRWNYTAVHPNVYLAKDAARDLYVNTVAAWLWTGRTGIVAGKAAAALHGVHWIEDNEPIELIARHGRRQPGVVIYEERIVLEDDLWRAVLAIGGRRRKSASSTRRTLSV